MDIEGKFYWGDNIWERWKGKFCGYLGKSIFGSGIIRCEGFG